MNKTFSDFVQTARRTGAARIILGQQNTIIETGPACHRVQVKSPGDRRAQALQALEAAGFKVVKGASTANAIVLSK